MADERDRAAAMRHAHLCVVINRTMGGDAKLNDFLPEEYQVQEPPDPDELIARIDAELGLDEDH